MKRVAMCVFALIAVVAVFSAQTWGETPPLRVNYLTFPIDWNGKIIMVGARFQAPLNVKGKVPGIVMLHNGTGVNYRGVYYAAALNTAGIATLEIDQWGARGMTGGPGSAPATALLPDVGGAYHLLAARPEIDASRIGLMGMSLGGIETMLMMTRRYSDAILGRGQHFQAAAALYPVCYRYNHAVGYEFGGLVDAPVRVLIGAADQLDDGSGPCEALAHDLAPADAKHLSVHVFANATHAFDGFDGPADQNNPSTHRGQGGINHIEPNPQAREEARKDVVAFFTSALK